ncbi:MAG: LptA/OstA family protein [Nitrospira sp.]|nr:LptA/OstA family protein [Nitrospira sp.]
MLRQEWAVLPSGSGPLDMTAERIDYRQEQEVCKTTGSVVIRQGRMTLMADHVTIQTLPGILTAVGHAFDGSTGRCDC